MLLDEEHRLIREAAREFAQERLAPSAAERDRIGEFPRDAIGEMAALGFLGMLVPEAWDGAGTDHLAYALVMEEIAAADGSCAGIMSLHNGLASTPILRHGTDDQKERCLRPMARGEMLGAFALTEPQAGSNALALKTRARRDGNGYVLSGSKQFVTNGSVAGVALVFAVTEPDAGKNSLSAFLVPADDPGYRVLRIEEKLGQHASDTCQIALEDVRVPGDHRLGEEGEGYRIALGTLEVGRIGIAAQSLGLARGAYDAALSYAKERESFGKPIIEHQAVGFRLADMATEIDAARLLTHRAALLRDAGEPCIKEAAMAKLFASEAAERICSAAIQVHGGYGYMQDFPIERMYRDVRVCSIYEGTSDIQRLIISRQIARE